ncbi:uncharacterized protein LOC115764430 isoform X2 [Drosophila novamexicana]|uniref:uncharacterized protein LOC115764430 isoform X2 n=1 Tax=Drosophila novamexicana TaxID=47314 RepID=UPI0011E593DB|nr:uncharacterized protein LOC115764430 isoform X2 [Drosophila novamexicana]
MRKQGKSMLNGGYTSNTAKTIISNGYVKEKVGSSVDSFNRENSQALVQMQQINGQYYNPRNVTCVDGVAQSVTPDVGDNVPHASWRCHKHRANLSRLKLPFAQKPKKQQLQPLQPHRQEQAHNNRRQQQQQQQRQGPLPGAANQWYALSNRVHKHGTTIEMLYTGLTVPQPREQLDVRAIPGVTHVTMELPAGVLPNIRNSTPDMPSLINAMNFFRCPERHPPTPGMGPSTTIQVIPKDNNNNINTTNIDSIEVMPLSCARAAPLKRSSLNVGFQSYSLMQLEVDEGQSQEPGRLVMDAEISPTYMLTTHQQLRLQAAIMQENVPLADALLPIVEDLYEEHEQLDRAGLQLLPAPTPLPYGTMRFHYGQPSSMASSKPVALPKASPAQLPDAVSQQSQDAGQRRAIPESGTVDYDYVNGTIMALDPFGNYQPMLFSDWCKTKSNSSK